MRKTKCPTCSSEITHDVACPNCGHAASNGATIRPPLPPELADVKFQRPTPEMLEEARRTFNEEEYLAAVREIEAGDGFTLEDFIDDIERITNGGK